ncbi:helix-turn-helix domain-containing protein [Sediminitomix flava]|uniref:Helix-turn-helix protein n=1 Tax=Sediminitomix flava TaxID=379075 RepID=A0A315ZGC8_SEDFL|nr:helix-turn-helix domain-containing protein [Sediminitomix flava]PWJ44203.1 helix-turn-helix protein [Sediminitomix flava]
MSQNIRHIDRQILAQGLQLKLSITAIAETLNVAPSTLYRELKRNRKKDGSYDPDYAHSLYLARKKRVGSRPKRKAYSQKKKPYQLYAKRKDIRWFSDTSIGRKPKIKIAFASKFSHFLIFRAVPNAYKTFDYRKDGLLYLLLFRHEGWKFKTMVDVLYTQILALSPTALLQGIKEQFVKTKRQTYMGEVRPKVA